MNRGIIKIDNENKNQETNNVVDPVAAFLSEVRNSFPEEDTSKLEAGIRMAASFDHNHKLAPETSKHLSQQLNNAVNDLNKDPQKLIREQERLHQIISRNPQLEQGLSKLNKHLGSSSIKNDELIKKVEKLTQTNNTQKWIIRGGAALGLFLACKHAFGNKKKK